MATRQTPDVAARARTFGGRVSSVHRAALHVDLLPGGGLLVVAIADVGGVPGGILVTDVTDLRETAVRAGMAFVPSTGGFSIPSAGVEIDVRHATTWSPALPTTARLHSTPAVAAIVAATRRLAAVRAPAGGLAPMLSGESGTADPWVTRAAALVGTQLAALRIGDVEAAIEPTIELIGLGVGLTPSGDDYLVGLLAGLAATSHPARHGLAAAIAAHAPGRTTAIGAAFLAHATGSAFAERLHDVLVAIARGRSDDVVGPIERVLAYGATSGGDTLVGLFCALDLALARPSHIPRAAA